MTALDQWPDVKAEAVRAGHRREVAVVQLALDNGYEPPLDWPSTGPNPLPALALEVEVSRQGVERLRLVVGRTVFVAPAHRKVARDGRTSQTRSVYLPDDVYAALEDLGAPADVMRAAVREYLERHHPEWRKG